MCECLIVASAPVRKFVMSPLDPGDAAYGVLSRCLYLIVRVTELGSANKATAALRKCSGRSVANNIVFLAYICHLLQISSIQAFIIRAAVTLDYLGFLVDD